MRLGVLLLAAVVVWVFRQNIQPSRQNQPSEIPKETLELAQQLTDLEAERNRLDKTLWARERSAEHFGRIVENIWDELNRSTNKLALLASAVNSKVVFPSFDSPTLLPHGISKHIPKNGGTSLTIPNWQDWLREKNRQGWELKQIEFRHQAFTPAKGGTNAFSLFYFAGCVENPAQSTRVFLEGPLTVVWTPEPESRIDSADASRLIMKVRAGSPLFEEVVVQEFKPPERSFFIDPLIVADMDGDGQSEIILAAANTVVKRKSWDRFEASTFCKGLNQPIFTGLIQDFNRDGLPDFLCATFDGLLLFEGQQGGGFLQQGRLAWKAPNRLKFAQILISGDIDRDGNLDLYLGQYRVPYQQGQMPTPFHDANDSHPAYILLGDGKGNFIDATVQSGMANHRRRRCYSASFLDLNHDGFQDLVVISDFFGAEVYLNNGKKGLSPAPLDMLPNSRAFGMSHLFTDFNRDGYLDFLMIGMNSPTISRLVHAGLYPESEPAFLQRAQQLTYGNRSYLGTEHYKFTPAPFSDEIASTGWSWGACAPDFNNDGFPDLLIVNGHESGIYTREYEPEFWLHDIHVGTSQEDMVHDAYFRKKYQQNRGKGWSYGGYERNRLFLNLDGKRFEEIGWLAGLDLQKDCRNLVVEDLDADGKQDVITTTFEAWPEHRQTLRIYKNQTPTTGNWISFTLRDLPQAMPATGTKITLFGLGISTSQVFITGDSYRSQHSDKLHFGLGSASKVERVEISWPNNTRTMLTNLVVNRTYPLR